VSVGIGGGIFPGSAAAGGGAGLNTATDVFDTILAGQTAFTLSNPYVAGGFILALVNTLAFDDTTAYFTAAGTAFTWLDRTFILGPGDCLVVIYETP
jgi:hypothetical protein